MRYVNCNLCGSDKYLIIDSHRKDKYCKPEVDVRTVICKNCGLVYINPRLDNAELRDFYSTTYSGTRVVPPSEGHVRNKTARAEYLLGRLGEQVAISHTRGKVLDVGCGEGSLLQAFQKRGWDAYGIEPTPHYAEFARERYGVEVITGFLEDASLPSSYFDVATLIGILEHLADPTYALATVRSSLKDGAIIFISVPNMLKPGHFRFFEAPHLYYFSSNTLSLLLRKTGFQPIRTRCSWSIEILARKSSVARNIDFSGEGDDYRKIIGSLKWRYILAIQSQFEGWLIPSISFIIRHVFGQSTGRKILELIKGFLHRT